MKSQPAFVISLFINMKYQIDQSNKIEQTEKDTIIAVSNDIRFAIKLKAKDKRIIQEIFRSLGKPRNFVYFTFAALLAILLKGAGVSKKVIIDQEYIGHERAIIDKLMNYLKRTGVRTKTILVEFGLLGKLSPAHILAARVATKKLKPDKIVSLKQILRLIFPKKKDRVSAD